MSINSVTVSGNLTRDPELRQAGNSYVLQMGLAVNDRVKERDEWVDRPNFFDVVVWGNLAESLSQKLSKGQKVAVAGKLRWSSWENNEGQKRSKVEIVANSVEFMSQKSDTNSTHPTPDFGEDIPF